MGDEIIPPGNSPLIEGLGPEWNDIVGYIPEDKRAEFAPKFQERIKSFDEYKQWDDLQKSGITPDQASQALHLYQIVENNPREVYDRIGQALGISAKEAEKIATEVQKEQQQQQQTPEQQNDPRFQRFEDQLNTIAQLMLAKNQEEQEAQRISQAEQALNNELAAAKKKYGDDFNEREVVMRMQQYNISAEDAYKDYANFVSQIRKTRPAPMLLGNGGSVPNNKIDPTKLDNPATKNLVAQMLAHANQAANQ